MKGKMRNFFGLFLTLLCFASFAANGKVKVTVNGMVCGFCAQGITKKFKAQDSVSTVDVQLSNKLVLIDLKEGKSLADEMIQKILNDSGYSVEKIERN